MYWIDIGIIVVIVLSVIIAMVRGFMREVVALATWVLAFVVSLSFSNNLAPFLPEFINSELVRQGLAWFILFAATMIIGALVNFLLNAMVAKTGLSAANRSLGALFGVARGVLIVCALILLGALMEMPKTNWWQQAKLLPYFQDTTVWALQMLPDDIAQKFQLPSAGSLNLPAPSTTKK